MLPARSALGTLTNILVACLLAGALWLAPLALGADRHGRPADATAVASLATAPATTPATCRGLVAKMACLLRLARDMTGDGAARASAL